MSSHLELDPARFSGRAGTKFGWREETVATGNEDPSTKGWARRPDDPNVQARLKHLRENNGLKGLEIVFVVLSLQPLEDALLLTKLLYEFRSTLNRLH